MQSHVDLELHKKEMEEYVRALREGNLHKFLGIISYIDNYYSQFKQVDPDEMLLLTVYELFRANMAVDDLAKVYLWEAMSDELKLSSFTIGSHINNLVQKGFLQKVFGAWLS